MSSSLEASKQPSDDLLSQNDRASFLINPSKLFGRTLVAAATLFAVDGTISLGNYVEHRESSAQANTPQEIIVYERTTPYTDPDLDKGLFEIGLLIPLTASGVTFIRKGLEQENR